LNTQFKAEKKKKKFFAFELGVPQGIYVSDNYSKLIIVQNLSLPRFDF